MSRSTWHSDQHATQQHCNKIDTILRSQTCLLVLLVLAVVGCLWSSQLHHHHCWKGEEACILLYMGSANIQAMQQ
jgi:hypothetical protein